MKIITLLSVFFIMYEIYKLFNIEKYWNYGINRNYKTPFFWIDVVYMAFIILLFFTQFCYASAIILGIGFGAIIMLRKHVIYQMKLNTEIKVIIFSDSILSMIVLLFIIIKSI